MFSIQTTHPFWRSRSVKGVSNSGGFAQAVRRTMMQASLVAAIAKPIPESCGREGFAVLGHQERKLFRLWVKLQLRDQLREYRNVERHVCFLAPHRKLAALDVLPRRACRHDRYGNVPGSRGDFAAYFSHPGERTGLVVTDQRRIHGAGQGFTRSYLWCGPILFHGTFARFHELRRPRQARERHTLATGQSKIEPRPPRGVYEMVGCSEEASPNVIPFVVGAGRRQYLAGEHNDFAVLIDP